MRSAPRPKVPAPWSTSPIPAYRKASFADVRGDYYGAPIPDDGPLNPFVIMTHRAAPKGDAVAMYALWQREAAARDALRESAYPARSTPPAVFTAGTVGKARIRSRSELNIISIRPEPSVVYPDSAKAALEEAHSLGFDPRPHLPSKVQKGLLGLGYPAGASKAMVALYGLLSLAGAGTGAYHGYKRNKGSVGWAIGWGVLGAIFPIITIPVSLAQGYAKPS